MKTIEIVTLYKCEFCGKTLRRKHAMARHELLCYSNPKNDTLCLSCHHLDSKFTMVEDSHYGGQKSATIFFCKKHNHFLHTPQNVIKDNAFEIVGDFTNKPMLKECKEFCMIGFDC